MKGRLLTLAVAVVLAGALVVRAQTGGEKAKKGPKEFTLVSLQIEKTKIWLPSFIVVEKGDKVKITLKNQIPGEASNPASLIHGFALDEFDVVKVVQADKEVAVEFTADKAGVFRMYCQLHPAHIGGQLLVLDK